VFSERGMMGSSLATRRACGGKVSVRTVRMTGQYRVSGLSIGAQMQISYATLAAQGRRTVVAWHSIGIGMAVMA
jgi:hypothetical protein